MSASIIQPKVLNPSRQPFFPQTTGNETQPLPPAASPAEVPAADVSVQNQRSNINARQRFYDQFTSVVAIVFVFCICASMIATGGWLLYELFSVASGWSSSDIFDIVKNNNL